MIAFNNNIYRTINDKFYLGNKQIGKVYLGTTLIYPEQTQEQENVIEGHKLEGIRLGGNVYDTGIAPTGGTTVEICFENKQNKIGPEGISIFGTHHDIYKPQNSGSTDTSYNPDIDNKHWSTKVYDKNEKFLGYKSHENCFTQWRNQTSFHFILKRKKYKEGDNNKEEYLYARYGGVSVQQNTNINQYTQSQQNINVFVEPKDEPYGYCTNYDNAFNSKNDEKSITISKESKYDYFFDEKINKTGTKGNNSYTINGKFFTIRMGYNNLTAHTETRGNQTFNYYDSRVVIGKGVGELYFGDTSLFEQKTSTVPGSNGSVGFSAESSKEGYDVKGGNLWIGSINRNFSSTENAVESNKIRNNFPATKLQYLTKEDFESYDCSDLDTNLFTTCDFEWVYIIIEDRDKNGNLKTISGKPVKYLFMPEKTTIIDSSNDYYVIFKRYPWNTTNNKFEDNPDTIILPFMKCAINNN